MNLKSIYWLDFNRFDTKPDKSTWLEMGHELSKFSFDVHLITSFEKRPFASRNHNVKFINFKASNAPALFKISLLAKSLVYVLREVDRSSILILPPAALIVAPVLRLFRFKNIHLDVRTIPVKVDGFKRSLDKWIFWDFSLRLFSRFAKTFSFITERLKHETERIAGTSFIDYCIWSSGVSSSMFHNSGRPPELRSSDDRFNIFYHGTVMEDRGVFELFRAVELLVEEKFDLSLTVVGSGPDYERLKQLVRGSAAEDVTVLTGFVPYEQVPGFISKADCCVCPLPRRPEWQVSSPLKLFEYMAMEKPIIATKIDAHIDVLQDQRFVVWPESEDAHGIAQSIRRAYINRRALNEAARSGPNLIKSSYDWRILGRRFGAFLRDNYGST
jgi:glycosyltransferase involved in cell wall biosynthesis